MRIMNPNIEVYPLVQSGHELERIEEIGRVCYKSEHKINEGTAERFVKAIINSGHESVLEHVSFCMELSPGYYGDMKIMIQGMETNDGYRCFLRFTDLTRPLVSGNVRAWRDFFKAATRYASIPIPCYLLIQQYPALFKEWTHLPFFGIAQEKAKIVDACTLTNPVERLTHLDFSVKFFCDRGVSHEFVRHRIASMSQESTRYCNYSGEMAVIDLKTAFEGGEEQELFQKRYQVWLRAMQQAEENYAEMIALGAKPQEARSVLPNSVKTELVMTMNGFGWRHFVGLRDTQAAHPQAREQAHMVRQYFEENYPWVMED